MRRGLRRLVAFAVAFGALLQPEVAVAAEAPQDQPLLVVGDSLCLGGQRHGNMVSALTSRGWSPSFVCEGGRRMEWGLEQVRGMPSVPPTVVVALGTNGGPYEVGFDEDVAAMRAELRARGAARILWVNATDLWDRYGQKNAALAAVASDHGDDVVDWAAYARSHPEVFEPDGVHYTEAGDMSWVWHIAEALGAPTWFPDIPDQSFFTAPARWAVDTGVTDGVGRTGLFAPHRPISRAEAVTFIWRALGREPAPLPGFIDTDPGAYYAVPVGWAQSNGVTTGVGGSLHFLPDQYVTRAELVTFLWRAADEPRGPRAAFADTDPGAFYSRPVGWAAAAGVTTGVGGSDRFEPDRPVTRAEAVTFIWRELGGR